MGNIDKAVEIVQTVMARYDEKELQAAQQGMKETNDEMQEIKSGDITNDEYAKELVEKFQLYKPENMARFFVEAGFAAIESINDAIDDLKKIDLGNTTALIKKAKREIMDAINNPEKAEMELFEAKKNLDEAIAILPEKMQVYIDSIKKMDGYPIWEFFLRSAFSKKKIDNAVSCAKVALQYLIKAVEVQRRVVALEKIRNPSYKEPSSIEGCIEDINTILDENTCSLMDAYDNKKDGFWLKVDQMLNDIMDEKCLIEYADEYDDLDFS